MPKRLVVSLFCSIFVAGIINLTIMIELKNELLTIKVAEMGAELQSIKDNDGREYMWQAGEKWPRHSPILFPIVCSVNNDT